MQAAASCEAMLMIVVETFRGKSVTDHGVEVVERKGLGHPDQICDSIMEAISVALCREYSDRFGKVLHHNIDKGLLAAGKNPVSHVGKIYNLLVHQLAHEVYQEVEGVKEVYVLLLSRIGAPVDQPQIASAQLLLERGRRINDIASTVEAVFERRFAAIELFCESLAGGDFPAC
jgi:S-adenosylmethionine synthetase